MGLKGYRLWAMGQLDSTCRAPPWPSCPFSLRPQVKTRPSSAIAMQCALALPPHTARRVRSLTPGGCQIGYMCDHTGCHHQLVFWFVALGCQIGYRVSDWLQRSGIQPYQRRWTRPPWTRCASAPRCWGTSPHPAHSTRGGARC
jgi:hypothetical protein